jgi:hypothetical protein
MTATEEATPADTPADPTAWRDTPLADLTTNVSLRHLLGEAGHDTAGAVHDLLDEDRDGYPPLNMTEHQQQHLCERLDELAAGDPDYRPFRPADEPVVIDDPTSPAALAAYDAATAKLVADFEGLVSELEATWEEKHADASLAKKAFEAERDKMRSLIRARRDDRGRKPEPTLFDQPVGDPAAPDPLADLWQQYPLEFARWEKFGLTEKDCEKLNSGETKNHGTHPMMTMGDVTRFITPDPKNPAYARTLKDVKGFGDKGMERWTEAETKFWQAWNNGEKEKFAAEKGVTAHADQPGPGGGDGGEGGQADAEAGDAPSLAGIDGGERNPLPDATAEPKRKGKAKGRGK